LPFYFNQRGFEGGLHQRQFSTQNTPPLAAVMASSLTIPKMALHCHAIQFLAVWATIKLGINQLIY